MFPFRSLLYNFTLDNSNRATSAWQVEKKTRVLESETLKLFQNNRVNSLYLLIFVTQIWIPRILCCLIAFPPHPFPYFLTSGYLLQTLDNSNFSRFPLKVRVIGSRLYIIFTRLKMPHHISIKFFYTKYTREKKKVTKRWLSWLGRINRT